MLVKSCDCRDVFQRELARFCAPTLQGPVVVVGVSGEGSNGALFPPNKAGPVTSKKPGLASHQRRKLDFAQKNAIISY